MSSEVGLWIKGGQVLDPATGRDELADVFVWEGKVVESLTAEQLPLVKEIDATGCVVAPGFIDMQVHFREPGDTHKETIRTGSQAAAAGGFTSVVNMGNTQPAVDSADTVQFIQEIVSQKAVVNVLPTACVTVGRQGEALAPIGSLVSRGVVALSDNESCVQNAEIMRRAAEYAQMFDMLIIAHCQDYDLTYGKSGAPMREGEWSVRLGMRGWPKAAEEVMVARDCIIARETGARIHFQHLTSDYSLELVRQAKDRGARVTAEVTPHHLSLTEEAVTTYDSHYKMAPPLCSPEDQESLWQGLEEGIVDVIASGHAPHQDYEKAVEFDLAPYGIVGLETFLPVMLYEWVTKRDKDLIDLLAFFTCNPARLLQMEENKGSLRVGMDADITIFNTSESWLFCEETSFSRSTNSPWIGQELVGRVQYTVVGGSVVFAQGALV